MVKGAEEGPQQDGLTSFVRSRIGLLWSIYQIAGDHDRWRNLVRAVTESRGYDAPLR